MRSSSPSPPARLYSPIANLRLSSPFRASCPPPALPIPGWPSLLLLSPFQGKGKPPPGTRGGAAASFPPSSLMHINGNACAACPFPSSCGHGLARRGILFSGVCGTGDRFSSFLRVLFFCVCACVRVCPHSPSSPSFLARV